MLSGRARLAEAHRRLLRALSYGATVEEVAQIATRWAMELLDAEGASATHMQDGELQYIAAGGTIAHLLGRRLELTDSFTGDVIRDRQARIYDREKAAESSRERAEQDAIQSGIVAPVLFEDRVAGTIGVTSRQPGKFDDVDVEVLSSLAEAFALSLALAKKQAELERARVEAEAADRAKSMFLATMSHELRSPMTVTVGMAELLLDTPLEDAQREWVHAIQTSSDSLLRIINDILDFSKIEAGKLSLENIEFDLRTLVEDVLDMLGARGQAKGLEVVGLYGSEVPEWIYGDAARMRQILANLIDNAIKYTQDGEVVVQVKQVGTRDDQCLVRFEVSDTGGGIPASLHETIFEVFTQVDSSSTRRIGGAGLGLAIVKKIVGMLGGEIGVESEVGKGSTFWFTLPVTPRPEAETQAPVEIPDLAGKRALVVEDSSTTRRSLRVILERWGIETLGVADGRSALDVLRGAATAEHPFDLTIQDMVLPDQSGLALARAIKREPLIASTEIVVISDLAQRGHGQRVRAAGVSGYLTKPIRESSLRDCLGLVLGLAGTPTTAPEGSPLVTRHRIAEETARHRPRILLAEDHIGAQKLVVLLLDGAGFRVDVVRNGFEAVAAVQRTKYDAVLMDCEMPELDGFEATERIRLLDGPAASVPIIALTAYALQGDRQRCLDAGMDDYVCKPFSTHDLVDRIRKLVL